jgi:chemotaxis protein methyltransferase CheR
MAAERVTVTEISARRAASPDVKGLRIPERTLELLRDLVAMQTGMFYDDSRLDILRDRLAPLALERGFDSFLDYYYLLKYDADAGGEWVRAIDALSVQETYFWREVDQIKAVVGTVVPRLAAQQRHVRIASVPCASGEEPLSIAIALAEERAFAAADIDICAGDASDAALRRARAGHYSGRAFRQLPPALQEKYFHPTGTKGEWAINADVHARVSLWSRTNVVVAEDLLRLGRFDVIFCRNLFIYFTPATITRVVETFAEMLPLGGVLCVGAAESLLRTSSRFELREIAGAFVYVKA